MGKLVRDRIPEIMRAAGKDPETRVLDNEEYRESLFAKLQEEIAELRGADVAHRGEELADVYEVVRALAAVHDVAWPAVTEQADRKRADRGGFSERIWLERW